MDEVDHLELVTQVMAPGLVTAMDRELPSAAGLRRSQGRNVAPQELRGRAGPSGYSVDEVTQGLRSLAERAAVCQENPIPNLYVTVHGGVGAPRLLVRQDGAHGAGSVGATTDATVWHELVDGEAGVVAVQQLTRSDAVLDQNGSPVEFSPADATESAACPFSAREHEVAELLARGLSDRTIAEELCLSPKTVEKHVGAVLRKTATTSRTAAVVHCMQRGWLAVGTSG
jgi:DNA-binding CsgD family transcriptional regulator